MMDIIAYFCIGVGLWLIYLAVTSILENGVSALSLSLVGFSLFGFLDSAKYYFFERDIRGDFGSHIYAYAIFFTFLSLILFLLGRRLIGEKKRLCIEVTIPRKNASSRLILILPAVVILSLMPPSSSYGTMINVFCIGFYIVTIYYFISLRKFYTSFLFISILILSIYAADYSSRRLFIAVSIPVFSISIYYINTMNVNVRRFYIICYSFVISSFYVFLNFLRSNHDFGEGYVEGDYIGNTISYITSLRSIDAFWNTCFIFSEFPRNFNFYWGETYFSILAALIPRAIWLNKPVGLSAPLGIMQRLGVQEDFDPFVWEAVNYYSLSPGLLGEAYANFGTVGLIVIPILIGCASKKLDNVRINKSIYKGLMYSPLLAVFFLLHRGDAYSAVLFPIFMTLGTVLAVRILYHVDKRK